MILFKVIHLIKSQIHHCNTKVSRKFIFQNLLVSDPAGKGLKQVFFSLQGGTLVKDETVFKRLAVNVLKL
jgi:hypothetical protein